MVAWMKPAHRGPYRPLQTSAAASLDVAAFLAPPVGGLRPQHPFAGVNLQDRRDRTHTGSERDSSPVIGRFGGEDNLGHRFVFGALTGEP